MKYHLIIRPQTDLDIREAFEWYESRQQNLGRRFIEELDNVFQRIEQHPLIFQKIYGELRRALTGRFPYAVYYLIDDNTVIVIAMLHQRKNPDEWRNRLIT